MLRDNLSIIPYPSNPALKISVLPTEYAATMGVPVLSASLARPWRERRVYRGQEEGGVCGGKEGRMVSKRRRRRIETTIIRRRKDETRTRMRTALK